MSDVYYDVENDWLVLCSVDTIHELWVTKYEYKYHGALALEILINEPEELGLFYIGEL